MSAGVGDARRGRGLLVLGAVMLCALGCLSWLVAPVADADLGLGGPPGALSAPGLLAVGVPDGVAHPAVTEPPLTEVVTGAASEVKITTAKLSGEVNPQGGASYYFEYCANAELAVCQSQTPPAQGLTPTEPVSGSTLTAVGPVSVSGLAPDTTYHYWLVARNGHGTLHGQEREFTTGPLAAPSELTAHAGAVTAETAQLEGTLNLGGSASYHFEYCPEAAPGTCGLATAESGPLAGESQQGVSVDVSGLLPSTTYRCWLVASNQAGSAHSPEATFKTAAASAPAIGGESFSEVTAESALVSSEVTPGSASTVYYVEYGPTSAYGERSEAAQLSAGEGPVAVSVRLGKLAATSAYHFRFVAENAVGKAYGADGSFTTLAPIFQGLPDGRGYEMVTPAENQDRELLPPKVSNEISFAGQDPTRFPYQVAVNGEAVVYVGEPTSPGGNGNSAQTFGDDYLGTHRPGGGWTQTNIQPAGYHVATYQGFSPDLTTGFLTVAEETGVNGGPVLPPLDGAPAEEGLEVPYASALAEGAYRPLIATAPPNRHGGEFGAAEVPSDTFNGAEPAYAGSSADASHVLFEANDALTPNAPLGSANENNLYESVDGSLKLVNVLPGNGKSEANATFGGPSVGGGQAGGPDFRNAISEDGSRVFWTDLNTGVLYVRENGAATVPVSAGPAQYWTATPDGRFAFYAEGERLWRFDVETEARLELAGAGAGLQGVIGTSSDGEYVYFVATGALAPGAVAGEPNLYLVRGGSTRLIATLSAHDGSDALGSGARGSGDWSASMRGRTAEVTPNGQALVFMSERSLTGYDNVESSYYGGPEPLEEVYVYDAEGAGRLTCASCNPSGEPPSTTVLTNEAGEAGGYLPISWSNTYTPQSISDDGTRVFFDSTEPLVPQDTNGKQDVYEWERDGAGSCHEAAGCIYLLSGAGSSLSNAWLVGADATGDNVFLLSRSHLVPEDGDESYNLFDARVGAVRPPVPSQCTGTGCQGVPSPPPVFATPASVTFEGVGNFLPSPATSSSPPPGVKATHPTARKKQLARALKLCHKRPRKRRAGCEARARKQYRGRSTARKASIGRS